MSKMNNLDVQRPVAPVATFTEEKIEKRIFQFFLLRKSELVQIDAERPALDAAASRAPLPGRLTGASKIIKNGIKIVS